MHKARLLCTTAICGALSWCVSEKFARAADLTVSNPPSPYVLPQLTAVGAFNGEIGAFGGGFNQGGVGIANGKIDAPLTFSTGAQIDGSLAADGGEMAHQRGTDPLGLIVIDDAERRLGLARLHDDIARAADDHRPAVFIGDRHQRDVFDEVDVEEMVGLLLRKLPLGGKEAMVKRLWTRSGDRRP